jgi:hypothetical protein
MPDRLDWLLHAPAYLRDHWALIAIALTSAWLVDSLMAGLAAEMWTWTP